MRRANDAPDWRVAEAEHALGATYAALGRSTEADALLGRSLPVLVRALGEDHRVTRRARERRSGVPAPR